MNAKYCMNAQSLRCIKEHIGQRNPPIYSENLKKAIVMSNVTESLGPLFESSVNGDSDVDTMKSSNSNNNHHDDLTKCTAETSNSHDDTIINLQNGSSSRALHSFDGRWKPGVRRDDRQSLSSSSDHGILYNTTRLTNRSSSSQISDPAATTTTDCLPTKPKRRGSGDFLSDSDSSEEQDREETYMPPKKYMETPAAATHPELSTLMKKIPQEIQQKLTMDEWKVVMVKLGYCSTSDSKDETDSFGDISEITGPTGVATASKNGDDFASSNSMESTIATEVQETIRPATRTWHESAKGSSAPSLPCPERHHSLCRRSSDPIALQQQQQSRWLARSSSLTITSSSFVDPSKRTTKVSFGTVQIRSYERILEVNPSTSSGPSVGIGWHYEEATQLSVSELESLKDNEIGRRSVHQLILPRHVREETLRECGYTSQQIANAVRRNIKAKNQRMQTIHNLRGQKVEEMVERSSRKVRRLFFRT
jgi:hypothetical protein